MESGGGKGGRAEAQQRCRRIGDGKFGRKREIQQGSHSPAREPGHFSLRDDSGSICACQQACDQPPPPPQFAAERCRLFRRSQSEPGAWSRRPASIGFLPHAGCLWTSPCPVCSVSGCDSPSYLSRRSRECVKPASQGCFRAPWNVALPRSFSSFPTLKSAHVRRGTEVSRNANQPSRDLSKAEVFQTKPTPTPLL